MEREIYIDLHRNSGWVKRVEDNMEKIMVVVAEVYERKVKQEKEKNVEKKKMKT